MVAAVTDARSDTRIQAGREVPSPVDRPTLVQARDVEVDLGAHLVRVRDRTEAMTGLELRLAALLVANAGRVVTRAEISEHGWGEAGAPYKAIEVYMSRIRRRIGADSTGSRYIRTVRSVGYIFDR